MNEYVSYQEVREELDLQEVASDKLIARMCEDASRRLDLATRLFFYPQREERFFDHQRAERLRLDRFLLEVEVVKTNNGNTTIPSYFLVPHHPPHFKIDSDLSDGSSYFTYTSTPQKAERITGVWGYHDDYDNGAWRDSGDALQADVGASDIELAVSNVSGADAWGRTPRFRPQYTIKVGSEFMYAWQVETEGEKLKVVRGINGSVAASHSASDPVYVWVPSAGIFEAALRTASWMLKRKDANTGNITAIPELGMMETPAGLPPEVKELVKSYRNKSLVLR